jgi:TolB protein
MNYFMKKIYVLIGLIVFVPAIAAFSQESSLGVFEKSGDIGKVGKEGSVAYDFSAKSYTVTGGGENIWGNADAFQFVWKQASGDVSLAADISFLGTGGNAHRKACLFIRQSLEPNSVYADAVVHGVGLTSLQYRQQRGDVTHEIQSNISSPTRIKIEKQGDYFFLWIAKQGEELHSAGGSFRMKLTEPFYIGLGVCAHDNNVTEKVVFSKVEIATGKATSSGSTSVLSTLETLAIASSDRRVVYNTSGTIEAPNWSHDGSYFIFNRGGKIYKLPVDGGEPTVIDTGFANRCNNDHGTSFDGKTLIISDASQERRGSLIYVLPIEGGTPKRVTANAPSYWHGISPDGKTLIYCADRNGNFDVYSIPIEGGEETRLTTAEGLDDGPEFSPDGKYIYFNSVRTGLMQIWRMKPDGSEQEQITKDEYNNWFPHVSPDGRYIAFLSYEKDVKEHPANKDVYLRLKPTNGGEVRELTRVFGGQGTINVPSWSPDSRNIAFVSYKLINNP